MPRFFKSKAVGDKPQRVFVVLEEHTPINPKSPALTKFYSPADDKIIEVRSEDLQKWLEKGTMFVHEPEFQNQTGIS